MDAISTAGAILVIILFMFCYCGFRRFVRAQPNANRPERRRTRRQKNARRKWRRRRQPRVEEGQVAILEHEAPCPASPAPGQNPHCHPLPHAPNPQYIINLNPPGQIPFHLPTPVSFPAQQQASQYPPQQHFNAPFPQNARYPPFNVQQQQLGGFAQLYAQAQPDMNVFPQPPPPYETEPFPPLPPNRK